MGFEPTQAAVTVRCLNHSATPTEKGHKICRAYGLTVKWASYNERWPTRRAFLYLNSRAELFSFWCTMSRLGTILGVVGLLGFSSIATAGEADDLQRMIDTAKEATNDLERTDDLKAAREDITLHRVWIDTAWRLRSEQKYDEVRVVLDRCQAQRDMIRQRIAASKAVAEATRKEAEVKKIRDKIAKTKEQIQAAQLQKAALGGVK